MECLRNTGKPGQRPRVGRCRFWKAPVEYGGHVSGRMEFAAGGGCLQVEEWVFTGPRRQSDEDLS